MSFDCDAPLPADRFWGKVRRGVGADDCWEWAGAKSGTGYGVYKQGRKNHSAHRFAYALAFGDPGPLHVLHRCDNRPCCNPAHLFLGSNGENQRDKQVKGRAAKKLTAEQVRRLRERVAAGETQKALAAEFGVCQQAVSYAVAKGWTHLTPAP
ncbi:HNH endonuclease [Limnoglobus roseus]|uniref:HNH endonuclease n=1 Tax=Limnoglobus roseus TaxID=2598579 RepID=A0A5C1ANX0_9BACT|nr:HNH endonuclease [Limnoglobus roseus]QEL19847.1 HNH endonuclease [Limnoglobus roseus]